MKVLKWTLGIAAAVGLVFALLVPVDVKGQPTGWLSFLTQDPQGTVQFRALDQYGFPVMVGHGTAAPTTANSGAAPMDGEIYMQHATGEDPILRVYSQTNTAWRFGIGLNEDDHVSFNSPVVWQVHSENFGRVGCAQAYEEDMTAAVQTNGGENFILMPCSQIGVIAYRIEAEDGGTLAATPAPFSVDGVLTLDGYADDVDNEGIELVFGSTGPDHLGAWFDEDSGVDSYCEVSITIADFSDVDDLWFGWVVQEAYDNPPASDSFDTSALFVISDLAGDLDIETELNAGGTLNDDTGTTWTDAASHTLRVIAQADAVEFWLDGVQVTQTNAVLNMDATDRAVCLMGYTIVAASDPGVTVNWVEIGREQ